MKTSYFGGGGGGGGAVSSVFGRIGAVVALLNDYVASLIGNDSGVPGSTVKDALDTLNARVSGVATPLSIPEMSANVDWPQSIATDAKNLQNGTSVPGNTLGAAIDNLGPAISKSATALTDADVTISAVVRQVLLASTLSTARQATITPSATPGTTWALDIGTQTQTYTIAGGGPQLGTQAFAAGGPKRLWITSDGANIVFPIMFEALSQEPIL